MSLTLDAKERILEMDEQGKPWRQIIEELGYDPKVLGKWRARNMVRNVRRDAISPNGIHEGYIRTAKKRLSREDINQLDDNPTSFARLKNEVIYLRAEVELLKKPRSG